MEERRLCILCLRENSAGQRKILWMREGPCPQAIFYCSNCRSDWYEFLEPIGFTFVIGASDYEELGKELRTLFTPLEAIFAVLEENPVVLTILGTLGSYERIMEIINHWLKYNQSRRVRN